MVDVKALLEEMKAEPFTMVEVAAPHTGIVEHVLKPGAQVLGPAGSWKEKPGTLLGHIERERNKKPIHAPLKGVIEEVAGQWNKRFVEQGTVLYTIRHYLTRAEVLEAILKKTLYLFTAPERAKYYFLPEVDKKIRAGGSRPVRVADGMDLFIVSRMKRETSLAYSGPEGIVYSVYFDHNANVDQGQPLIGVCPEDQLDVIKEVVTKVQSDWEEPE